MMYCSGDVNGDGFDDVIIGAPGFNTGAGAVYVLFGKLIGFETSIPIVCMQWMVSLYWVLLQQMFWAYLWVLQVR